MTGNQIKKASKDLLSRIDPTALPADWPEDIKQEYEELDCREMINSILIYGGTCAKDSYEYKRYLKPFITDKKWHRIQLTEQRVDELITEQKADFAKAKVGFAGCDSEGGGYNYCRWADEQ